MTSFSLRQLRLRSGDEWRDEVSIALEPFDLAGARYLPVPAEVPAMLEIQRASSGDVFRLRFRARLHGPCMRCLEDAVVPVDVDAREYQAADEAADPELRSEYVTDDQLDLTQWARDAIALQLPDQIVCRPDCAGLCAVCGQSLDRGSHEHDEKIVDPRWAALEALREDG